jgi:transcriptional regulator with GAF, ATPase, and Fis domain
MADVRFIAATNRNLKDMIEGRSIRETSSTVSISSPFPAPRRERKEDIPLLIDLFVAAHAPVRPLPEDDESALDYE